MARPDREPTDRDAVERVSHMLPIVVSFVARLVTLAETSIFISPFGPDGRT